MHFWLTGVSDFLQLLGAKPPDPHSFPLFPALSVLYIFLGQKVSVIEFLSEDTSIHMLLRAPQTSINCLKGNLICGVLIRKNLKLFFNSWGPSPQTPIHLAKHLIVPYPHSMFKSWPIYIITILVSSQCAQTYFLMFKIAMQKNPISPPLQPRTIKNTENF